MKQRLTLSSYVRRRTGVPLGARGSLGRVLRRSLGASSFAGFWRYWNPIFGYGLGRYVFVPLKRIVPPDVALVVTFVVCGALHDGVTMVARGSAAFLFTPWFFLLGLGVLFGQAVNMDLSRMPWGVRAGANIGYITLCLVAVLGIKGLVST
jgi:D-alanyl-lipoteichoic acid acyltransferase DltB (MBOAT superfamily)